MMTLSQRERWLGLVALFVVLFGLVGFTARGRIDHWRHVLGERRVAEAEQLRMKALIAQRDRWRSLYAELKDLLPVFAPDRQVDTHWLGLMDRLAVRHGVSILRRQVGVEQPVGEVFELPIEVREWDGTLESMLRFLYDLQSEGAMLDVRQMLVRPRDADNPEILRGRFTVYCAYLRNAPPGETAGSSHP